LVVRDAELLPPVPLHRPHFASGVGLLWTGVAPLLAEEAATAGLDACAASAGSAIVPLNNNALNNSVLRFINPPNPSLSSVSKDRELCSTAADRVTLTIYDAGGSDIASSSGDVTAAGVDRERFVFPGDVAVTPGLPYAIRVSGRVTFGWKYVVGGYERGAATFNGRPFVANTRTTFLFRTLGSH
jgi:hypothetical protein